MGSIPRTGESFLWYSWYFEVVDMDGNRIDKLLVSPVRSDELPPNGSATD